MRCFVEIGGIKPDMTQILKEQAPASGVRGENAPVGESVPALPVNAQAARSTEEALRELLVSYGLNTSSENVELMEKLLENGMPSDKESLLKLNQALKLFNMLNKGADAAENKTLNLERALFTLKNQLPITQETVYKMDGFLSESKSISANIDIIMKELGAAEKSPALDEILRIFAQDSAEGLMESSGNTAQNKLAEGSLQEEAISTKIKPDENLSSQQKQALSDIMKDFIADSEDESLGGFMSKLESDGEGVPVTREQAFKAISENFSDNPEISKLLESIIGKNSVQEDSSAGIKDLFRKFRLSPEENDMEKLEQILNELRQKAGEALKAAENADAKLPDYLTKALRDLNNNMEFIDQLKTCVYVPIPLNAPTGPAEGELYVFKDKRSKQKGKGAGSALIGLNTVNLGRVEAYVQKQENKLNLQFRLENMDINKLINTHAKTLINLLEAAGLKLTSLSIIPLDSAFDILKKEPLAKEASYVAGNWAFDTRA